MKRISIIQTLKRTVATLVANYNLVHKHSSQSLYLRFYNPLVR